MAGLTQADRLPPVEDFDYSVSHRPVPVPDVAHNVTHARQAQHYDEERGHSRSGSAYAEGRRFGSISIRRKNSVPRNDAPPLPSYTNSRIVQATPIYAPAADTSVSGNSDESTAAIQTKRGRSFSFGRKASGEDGKMLRKSSKMRQAQLEQERAREAANAVPKQPPQLPTITNQPGIAGFGGDDVRPDSVAIFNNQYTTSPGARQAQPGATANFSRPGNAAMSSSSYNNSSSSPAYAARSGNAFAQQAAAASSSPAVGGNTTNGEYVIDPSRRSESMTNRGRYSSASNSASVNVNSPRRIRRRKDPTPFNILVIGAKNSGKTSFISFLRHSLALPANKQPYSTTAEGDSQVNNSKSSFTSHYLETDMDGERIGLTLWDSAGLEKHIIDLQMREMAAFVESKFEETFVEEQKVMRSPGAKDTHIHCAFLVLDPVRLDVTVAAMAAGQKGGVALASAGGLDDDLDLQVIRALWNKTTVIPIISKADTLTVGHISFLKRAVWDSLKEAKLDPLEALDLEGDEDDDEDASDYSDEETDGGRKDGVVDNLADDSNEDDEAPLPKSKKDGHNRQVSLAATVTSASGDELPYIPMSILSPDLYDLPPYAKPSKTTKIGRRFPWGLADPYDPEHCDFTRLRDSIFSEWRSDLRDLSRTKWYENWRTSRLKNFGGSKQRVKGGVTPVTAVPKEGRFSPKSDRDFSGGSGNLGTAASIPRTVSGSTAATGGIGMAVGSPTTGGDNTYLDRSTSKAERTTGVNAPDAGSVASRGGTYRGVDTYQ